MNYKIVDKETYYRKGVFRHFSEDCKCSTSITSRINVTGLKEYSERKGTKFYINFLYILSKVLNSREDYRMGYLWQTEELICFDQINPTQYVFHEDTETCTPVYTEYQEDYDAFYQSAIQDIEQAKNSREYGLDMVNHPNWFDASFISWLSYDSLNIELPDGHLYFQPVINWGKYREENGKLVMPVTVRLNHAIADGYLVAKVFQLLDEEIAAFCRENPVTPDLRTERLLLRKIQKDDVDAIFNCWMRDEVVSRYMFWKASEDRTEAEKFVEFELGNLENDQWNRWILVTKDTNEIAGTCLIYFNEEENHWDISYNLGRKYWGRGYITEAMNAVMQYGREKLNMEYCETACAAENTASAHVLEKLGFVYRKEVPYECNGGTVSTIGKQYVWSA